MPRRALIEKRPWLVGSIAAAVAFYALRVSTVPELYLIPVKGAACALLALYALFHGGREGRWLGDVDEDELRRLWEVAPLACMSEVLTVRAAMEEAQAGSTWRPRVVLETPLQQVLQVAQRWTH